MERTYVRHDDILPAYDYLQFVRSMAIELLPDTYQQSEESEELFKQYYRTQKVLPGESSAAALEQLHDLLFEVPYADYKNVAGWAAAEAALIAVNATSIDRVELLNQAEVCWRDELSLRENELRTTAENEYTEDVQIYRAALNLAYIPLMKSIVVGDVTQSVRERVFADILAVADLAGVQRSLSFKIDPGRSTDFLGFEHECNAHLALLHMNDPQYVPLPSTARGGSGTDHPEQTHDIVVLNQRWGTLLKATPIEIKAKASMRDLKRYNALIVRGKMHLSIGGYYMPEHTRRAFSHFYQGIDTAQDAHTVFTVTDRLKRILKEYSKGKKVMDTDSKTIFRSKSELEKVYPEFSLDRQHKY